MARHLGLHFPRQRWRDLERGVRSAAREFKVEDAEAFVDWLLASQLTRNQIQILASHLTVGETYFFREKRSLDLFGEYILPELIRTRPPADRKLRIWSAGCATGEEPYSIAIKINEMPCDWRDWNITLLATDLNPLSLQKASAGVYSEWSFRGTRQPIKQRYFTKTKDGRWAVAERIRKEVTFAFLNLAEDVYPSLLNNTNALDVIFCRNVLMYFAPEVMKRVIRNLHRSLVNGGWLIVSPTETSHTLFPDFVTVNFPGATLYRRQDPCQKVTPFSCPVPGSDPDGSRQAAVGSIEDPEARNRSTGRPAAMLAAAAEESDGEQPRSNSLEEALTLYQRGCYEEAAESAKLLLSQNPADVRAMALLARVYANQGNLVKAREWCEQAIAADKMDARCHYLRATVLQEQGAVEQAEVSLRRTLYLDPHFVLAHFTQGNLALHAGKDQESKKHFGNALALLAADHQDHIVPESEGLTAGRLREIITLWGDQTAGLRQGRRKPGAGSKKQGWLGVLKAALP